MFTFSFFSGQVNSNFVKPIFENYSGTVQHDIFECCKKKHVTWKLLMTKSFKQK